MYKRSSIIGVGAALAANEALFAGLKVTGKKGAPNLLHSGIELSKNKQRMNPNTETTLRNVLGSKQLAPYDAGQKIGIRMAYMEPEKQNRFLSKVTGMGAARKNRLETEGEKVKDPILKAVADYNEGKGANEGIGNRILQRKPAPIGRKTKNENIGGQITTAPGILLDHRMAIRPLLREFKETSKFKSIDQKMQDNKVIKKSFEAIKEYYD